MARISRKVLLAFTLSLLLISPGVRLMGENEEAKEYVFGYLILPLKAALIEATGGDFLCMSRLGRF